MNGPRKWGTHSAGHIVPAQLEIDIRARTPGLQDRRRVVGDQPPAADVPDALRTRLMAPAMPLLASSSDKRPPRSS